MHLKDDLQRRGERSLAIPVFPVFRVSRGEAARSPNQTTSLGKSRNDDNAPRPRKKRRSPTINKGGIREPATGLSSRLVERTKTYIF